MVQVEAFIGETVAEGIIMLTPVKGDVSSLLLAIFSNESHVCWNLSINFSLNVLSYLLLHLIVFFSLRYQIEGPERESVSMEMQQPVAPPDALPNQCGPPPEKKLPQPASSHEASQGVDPASAFREGLPSSLQPRDPETRVWSKDSDALEAVSIGE